MLSVLYFIFVGKILNCTCVQLLNTGNTFSTSFHFYKQQITIHLKKNRSKFLTLYNPNLCAFTTVFFFNIWFRLNKFNKYELLFSFYK